MHQIGKTAEIEEQQILCCRQSRAFISLFSRRIRRLSQRPHDVGHRIQKPVGDQQEPNSTETQQIDGREQRCEQGVRSTLTNVYMEHSPSAPKR